jgi:uncharacterized repeat protein (TIGR04138 family)
MTMTTESRDKLLQAIWDDGRYPPEAYEFLHQGLEYTTRKLFGDAAADQPHHVTGQQLCEGLRELALERWGLLAKTVLNQWSVRRTRDFGEMVYFLIRLGMMGKREEDRLEDFDDVYDFEQAFASYRIPLDTEESEGVGSA